MNLFDSGAAFAWLEQVTSLAMFDAQLDVVEVLVIVTTLNSKQVRVCGRIWA